MIASMSPSDATAANSSSLPSSPELQASSVSGMDGIACFLFMMSSVYCLIYMGNATLLYILNSVAFGSYAVLITIASAVGMNAILSFRPRSVSAINHRVSGFVMLLALVSIKYEHERLAKHWIISLSVTGGVLLASLARTD